MAKATLRKMKPADHEGVVAMYGAFEPKGEFQGLPPRNRELTMRWLQRLRESGSIEFVIEVNRRIVGHSMLCLEEDKIRAELAIFLHQDYRGRGLGKRLLLGTLNYGCQILKLSRVWLSVQGSNPYALYLFEKVGFRSHGETEPSQWELEMERPSHCEHCREQQCILFGQSLPVTINLPTRKSNTA